jgi:hypothetical protein
MSASFTERPVFVASYSDGTTTHFLPLSESEIDRRVWFYRRIFDSYGLPHRRNVLIISNYEDHALTMPLQTLLHMEGHIPCYAEATSFDARRTESFMRRMDISVVIGANTAVLDGLEAIGFNPLELFAGCIVFARDENAYQRLSAGNDIVLRRWMDIGPAVALECRHGGGMHVDANEWIVEAEHGEVLLTSRLQTLVEFNRTPTGFHGTLVNELCACGREGVRILPGA